MACHGKPLAKYRKQATCKKNNECGENAFCDMDIERTEGFNKDEGVCCSGAPRVLTLWLIILVPEKCGGEAAIGNEVGLSLCLTDDQCSLDNGEICSKSFLKEPESRWTAEDGVCCKSWFTIRKEETFVSVICPNSTNIEAEKNAVFAGKRCAHDKDCSSVITPLLVYNRG